MAQIQQALLLALLNTLYDRELLIKTTYDNAVNLVNSTPDFPDFFEHNVRSREEDEENGCP